MASTLQFHPEVIKAMVIHAARVAAQWMANVLVGVVHQPGAIGFHTAHGGHFGPAPAPEGPIFHWHPKKRTEGPYTFGSPVGTPPYMRSGKGVDSIGWQVIDKGSYILIRIGVDDSAPGGTTIKSYLLAHEYGIHYPTRGPMKGTRLLVRPWLMPTVRRYAPEFQKIFAANLRMGV